jgi:hypothetical protein
VLLVRWRPRVLPLRMGIRLIQRVCGTEHPMCRLACILPVHLDFRNGNLEAGGSQHAPHASIPVQFPFSYGRPCFSNGCVRGHRGRRTMQIKTDIVKTTMTATRFTTATTRTTTIGIPTKTAPIASISGRNTESIVPSPKRAKNSRAHIGIGATVIRITGITEASRSVLARRERICRDQPRERGNLYRSRHKGPSSPGPTVGIQPEMEGLS